MVIAVDFSVKECLDNHGSKDKSAVYEKMGSAPSADAHRSRVLTKEEKDAWTSIKENYEVQKQWERGVDVLHKRATSED